MAAQDGAPAGCGLLSVVGTPIGNLSDASPRVIETLRSSQVVLCEDTRVTGRLMSSFGLHVPLQRADENVLARRIEGVIERLQAGEHVSFVSDAGMPGVSDPGQRLVDAALNAGLRVEVIPGPSAITCALVASGLPMEHFYFEGFLPRKHGALVARLRELVPIPGALVMYESPHRVAATLAAVAEVFPQRRAALVRELTKLHEEVLRGPAPQLAALVAERDEIKGECVVVIEGPVAGEERPAPQVAELPLDEAIVAALEAGEPKSVLAKRLSRERGLARSAVYDRVVELARTVGGRCL